MLMIGDTRHPAPGTRHLASWRFSTWLLLGFFVATAAWADGLPDQGFDNGPPFVRTEYYFSNEGTSANPLTIDPCIFPASGGEECQNPPTVYKQSNYWSQNACLPWEGCGHWNLILNNEDAYTNLNPGPPDASLPRSLPGQGIFGFNTIYDNFPGNNVPGDNMWRAHLVLNMSSQFPNPTTNRLPYMALGAWTGNGAAGPIGVLNPSNSGKLTTIQFGTRLWQWIPTTSWPDSEYQDQGLVLASYFVAFANWGSHPKAIQVDLFHWGLDFHGTGDGGIGTGRSRRASTIRAPGFWPSMQKICRACAGSVFRG